MCHPVFKIEYQSNLSLLLSYRKDPALKQKSIGLSNCQTPSGMTQDNQRQSRHIPASVVVPNLICPNCDAPSDPPHEPVGHLAGAGLAIRVGGPVVAALDCVKGAGGKDCYCESNLHNCFRFGCPMNIEALATNSVILQVVTVRQSRLVWHVCTHL